MQKTHQLFKFLFALPPAYLPLLYCMLNVIFALAQSGDPRVYNL